MSPFSDFPIKQPEYGTSVSNGKGLGIASLVLGITAILSSMTGIGSLIGIACGIIGLVLGARARKILPADQNGIATAGWICSIVSLAICGVALLFVFGLFALLGLMAGI